MDGQLTASIASIVESMSKATDTALEPLRLLESDRLVITTDKAGRKFLMRVGRYNETTGGIYEDWGSSSESRTWWERLPERRMLDPKQKNSMKEVWVVAMTDYTVITTLAAWGYDRIIFDDDAKLFFDYMLKRFQLQARRAKMMADYKVNGTVPAKPADWRDHPNLPLSDYQFVPALAATGMEALALFMDRGTGKTATAVQIICMRALRNKAAGKPMLRVLCVVPQQVRVNWHSEIARFNVARGKSVVVRGGKLKRYKKLREGITIEKGLDYGVVIASYDAVASSMEAFERVPWDLIILDESHYIKDPRTRRSKSILALRDLSKSRVILTGTPIGNSPMDLWAQLEFLAQGMSGFENFQAFKNFFGEWEEVEAAGHGIQRLVDIKNVPLLQERLARVSFSVTKEEAGLKLPDKVYDQLEVQMTKKQAETYKRVAEQLVVEIESLLSEDTGNLVVDNILAKLMRLAQITSGHVTLFNYGLDGEVTKRWVEQCDVTNPKIDVMVEDLTSDDMDPKCKAIVWAVFREDIRVISTSLAKRGIKHVVYYGDISAEQRDEAVRAFNCDKDVRVFVANPQVGGEGLDLLGYDKTKPAEYDTYCGQEYFFSQNWSSILRMQAEDRAHRRGARMPVRITDLVVVGTIDEEIRKRVQSKQSMALTVTDIRGILKAISEESEGDDD